MRAYAREEDDISEELVPKEATRDLYSERKMWKRKRSIRGSLNRPVSLTLRQRQKEVKFKK